MDSHLQKDLGDDSGLRWFKKEFVHAIELIKVSEQEYRAMSADVGMTDEEEVLIAFSPWLIALALALRLTKVTAIWRGYA